MPMTPALIHTLLLKDFNVVDCFIVYLCQINDLLERLSDLKYIGQRCSNVLVLLFDHIYLSLIFSYAVATLL